MHQKYCHILICLLICGICSAQKGDCLSGNCTNGFGHFKWKAGEEYIGNFMQAKMHGFGIFYWKNKKKYIGNWTKGKIDGRGTLFSESGDIKKGLWKANKFIKIEREIGGVSPETITHGQEQLNKIILDRPAMQTIVDSNDIIWNWVVNKLAGEDISTKIYWQATASEYFPIPTGVKAVHAYPTAYTEGKVWVKNTKKSEQMWSSLIFELHNIRNGKGFQSIENNAKKWNCTKKQYIEGYAKLEYKAAAATKAFYINTWRPYCLQKGIKTEPVHWFYYLPNTFEEWLASFEDKSGYPWHPYANYYDKIVIEVVKKY